MCTVTYLPLDTNEFILTSSRDVPFSREKALEPKNYLEDGVELYYPKDGKAGGTWIGTSSKNRLICLLNGGFENHIPKENYRKSRGEIVKFLLKCNDLKAEAAVMDLVAIEPFTLVVLDWNNSLELVEFIWDGHEKHLKVLPQKSRIWSSSTLYSEEMKEMRRNWFEKWKEQYEFTSESIFEFHQKAGIGDPNVDVLMKRPKVGTVSITQVNKNGEDLQMRYMEI
jgi:hypothetical protein